MTAQLPVSSDGSEASSQPGSPVRCERDGAVATVTLMRPDVMNALDLATKIALRDSLADVAADETIRAVVLTGSGRGFCVGQDLREHTANLRDRTLEEIWATVPDHFAPIAHLLMTMPKPVIAAVNGVAAGAGASIAFACDIRLVADTASFNTAFTAIGLSCDTGISWTLPRLIGAGRALDLLLMPRTVRADEASELGLAHEVVPAADLASAAADLARTLAAGPTLAYAAVKQAVAYASTHTADEALAHEGALMASTGGTADHRDAVASFVAKEKPTFRGR